MKLKYAFLCLLLMALLLTPQAVGLEVTNSIAISGTGVIDRESCAETQIGWSGIKYSADFYTKSLGLHGLSKLNYTSDFTMLASDELNSTLDVNTAFEGTELKQMTSLRHYGLKSWQSFWTRNDTEAAFAFSVNNCSSSFDLVQNLSGAGGYKLLVLNSTNYHVHEYLDMADYKGNFELLISNYVGCTAWPGEDILRDWLLCP